MGLLREVFTGRKVLVTGHSGFKGVWLCLLLRDLGAEVHGFSLPGPAPLFDLLAGRTLSKDRRGDIRSRPQLTDAFKEEYDYVFHLAAQAFVRRGYRDPVETFETNVVGTANVLECVRNSGRPCVTVVVTSDKCYLNKEWVYGYREVDELGGQDPYSASKAAAEMVVSAFQQSFFGQSPHKRTVALASARAGNVLGGGDFGEDRLIPDLVRAIQAGKSLEIRYPAAVRPWQHVLDPLVGYLTLAARLGLGTEAASDSYSGAWNFGPIESPFTTVSALVEIFIRSLGEGSWVREETNSHVHEASILRLDIDKAMRFLDWRPKINLMTTVEMTADWYRRYLAGDMDGLEPLMNEQVHAILEAYEE